MFITPHRWVICAHGWHLWVKDMHACLKLLIYSNKHGMQGAIMCEVIMFSFAKHVGEWGIFDATYGTSRRRPPLSCRFAVEFNTGR